MSRRESERRAEKEMLSTVLESDSASSYPSLGGSQKRCLRQIGDDKVAKFAERGR